MILEKTKKSDWKRKDLKAKARHALKINYWQIAIVSLLTFFLVRGLYNFSTGGTVDYIHLAGQGQTNTDIVNNFIHQSGNGLFDHLAPFLQGKTGVMANLFNNFTKSGSFLFGFLNALNQMLFGEHVTFIIILLIGVIGSLCYNIFVRNIVQVGVARFFLENVHYKKTRMGRISYLYQIGKVGNVAKIMFLKNLFLLLWDLTIIGGIIKHYSYRMIPYILAENPGMCRKDAFLLSRRMMNGQKWRVFLLDCSFILWLIPTVLTLGIFDYFFLYPYRAAADAELYFALRHSSKGIIPEAQKWLVDDLLIPGDNALLELYPVDSYLYPIHEHRKWTLVDYRVNYSLYTLILLFFSFSLFGWLWEVGLNVYYTGHFVDRGTLYGPLLPIYGTGGVLILILLKRFREKPVLYFFMTTLLCGIVEYTTAWYLATFKHAIWWDYSNMIFNIQGRVCLEGLLSFGLGGCLFTYVLAPLLNKTFSKIPQKTVKWICIVLAIAFTGDFIYAQFYPNMAAAKPISFIKREFALVMQHQLYPINKG